MRERMREPLNQYDLEMRPVEKACAFTGHRTKKITGGLWDEDHPTVEWVKQALLDVIIKVIRKYKVIRFISGMALGVDMWAAEAVLHLRDEKDVDVELWGAVPFQGQERMWPQESQERYRELLQRCDAPVLVSDGEYAGWKFQKRNEFMVDHSDMLVAVHNGSSGGTMNCLRYAASKGTEYSVYLIDPEKQTSEWL